MSTQAERIVSMTYGDLVKRSSQIAATIEPHVWDNMNISEQRDWALSVIDRQEKALQAIITAAERQMPKPKIYPAHGSGFFAFYDPAEFDTWLTPIKAAIDAAKASDATMITGGTNGKE